MNHEEWAKSIVISGDLHIQESEILDARWFTYNEMIKLNDNEKLRNT